MNNLTGLMWDILSNLNGARMSSFIEQLMQRRKKNGSIGAIDFLIEYESRRPGSSSAYVPTYKPFSCVPLDVPKDLERFKKRPKNFPDEAVIPPIVGPGNDYSHLEGLKDENPEASGVRISVVVLTYNRMEPLRRTLAGLCNQKYNRELFEVIVTDDGSSSDTISIIREYQDKLQIRYVWHRDVGFTAASARNNGIAVARNDLVVLLDVDMYPSSGLLLAYAKWWRAIDRIVMMGPRKYIDLDGKSPEYLMRDPSVEGEFEEVRTNNDVAGKDEGAISIDWRLEIFDKTNQLRGEKRPYRVFASGNVAFSKRAFYRVGGFDERFKSWGYEDTELGFRFYNNGYYFIPEMSALAFHQEPAGGVNEVSRSEGKSLSGEHFGDVCPHYRRLTSKKSDFEVPTVSIYIPAYNAEKTICDAVDSALRQSYRDLNVCVCDDGSTDGTRSLLERYFGSHPRVKIVSQRNGGIGAASNAALRITSGLYVGQLDSDDYLALDVVEKCVIEFEKSSNIGLVYTSYENEYSDGRVEAGYNYPVYSREKLLTAMIVHHFRMFRRLYWCRTDGFNERIKNAVDYDMYLKLAEVCDAVHLNVVGYRRRLHGENTSIVNLGDQVRNAARVLTEASRRMSMGYVIESNEELRADFSYRSMGGGLV